MHQATDASPLGDRFHALDVGRRIQLRAADRAWHQQTEHAFGMHRVQHVRRQFVRRIDAWGGCRQQRRELAGPGDMVGRDAGLVHVHRIVSPDGPCADATPWAARQAKRAGRHGQAERSMNSPWMRMLRCWKRSRLRCARPRAGPGAPSCRRAWRRRLPRCDARRSWRLVPSEPPTTTGRCRSVTTRRSRSPSSSR